MTLPLLYSILRPAIVRPPADWPRLLEARTVDPPTSEPSPQPTTFPPDALIISAATTGSWPTKAQNPNVPTTPEEIAQAAVECGTAGAAIVHIHVRDDDEKVTCDPARYASVRDLVEAAGSNVIINMSTGGGAGHPSDEQHGTPLALAPEIASFDCGSVNLGERVFINSPIFLRELATRMKTYGVKPRSSVSSPVTSGMPCA